MTTLTCDKDLSRKTQPPLSGQLVNSLTEEPRVRIIRHRVSDVQRSCRRHREPAPRMHRGPAQ